ncbi:MAG TPA: LPS assembly lipoprotein LptE [Micavibrio sp.]|jgi:LPS-assembly lipoprotein
MKAGRFFLRVLIPGLCILMAGCGFTPLYGSGPASARHEVQDALNSIAIDNIPDRAGQNLRNRLIDRFHTAGTPSSPRYRLTLSPVEENQTDLDITKTADTTRAQLRLSSEATLRDAVTGAVLLTRSLSATTSYNILSSQFTTRVSEDNARLNALDDLARQAELQMVLYFRR